MAKRTLDAIAASKTTRKKKKRNPYDNSALGGLNPIKPDTSSGLAKAGAFALAQFGIGDGMTTGQARVQNAYDKIKAMNDAAVKAQVTRAQSQMSSMQDTRSDSGLKKIGATSMKALQNTRADSNLIKTAKKTQVARNAANDAPAQARAMKTGTYTPPPKKTLAQRASGAIGAATSAAKKARNQYTDPMAKRQGTGKAGRADSAIADLKNLPRTAKAAAGAAAGSAKTSLKTKATKLKRKVSTRFDRAKAAGVGGIIAARTGASDPMAMRQGKGLAGKLDQAKTAKRKAKTKLAKTTRRASAKGFDIAAAGISKGKGLKKRASAKGFDVLAAGISKGKGVKRKVKTAAKTAGGWMTAARKRMLDKLHKYNTGKKRKRMAKAAKASRVGF